MPAANPRLSVVLSPSAAAVVDELAVVTKQSKSAVVASLVDLAVPVFERVVVALRAAQQVEEGAKGEIAEGLDRAQRRLEVQLGLAMDDMEQGFRPLLQEAEKVERRRAAGKRSAAASGRPTPVPVTRGSGPPAKGAKGRKRRA